MSSPIAWEKFGVSRTTGFAAELHGKLPDEFAIWHELASSALQLSESGTFRQEVLNMPMLDSSSLETDNDLRLALLQLTQITIGYVWGAEGSTIPASLPACLAVPLCDVADRLGSPAGLSFYVSMMNWERIDKDGPYTRNNMRMRYRQPGGKEFEDFVLNTVLVEFLFANAFPELENFLLGMKGADESLLISSLEKLKIWMDGLTRHVERFHKILPCADTFYRVMLRWLKGFHEKAYHPEGMTYEGVANSPRKTIDTVASGTVIFQVFDLLLSIEHSCSSTEYFKKVRSAWPTRYRQFYVLIESWPGRVKELVQSGGSDELAKAYTNMVDAIVGFRDVHLQLYTKYQMMPNRKLQAEKGNKEPARGQPFLMSLLKGIRDNTKEGAADSE